MNSHKKLSPEEEMRNIYFHMNLGNAAMFYMIVSTVLTVCALYLSGLPHLPLKIMVDDRAKWMKEHYIVLENGSKIYYWPDENGVWQQGGLGVWHDHMLNGEIRYEYGNAWLNYCFPRDFIPEREWIASLFRAMQQKASVQCILRIAVLLTLTNGLMKCLCFSTKHSIQSPNVLSWLIVYLYTPNELLHSLSLFAITELQMYQDEKYFYMVQPAFFVLSITLIMKLVVNSIMEGLNYFTAIRILCIPIIWASYFIVVEDIEDYVDHPNCDANVLPIIFLCQLSYLIIMFYNGICEFVTVQRMDMTMICTMRELDDRYIMSTGLAEDNPSRHSNSSVFLHSQERENTKCDIFC